MITTDSQTILRPPPEQLPEERNSLVSVIIPFLDTEKFLAEAIASVLAQSYEHWELLLIDDGSTDRSRDIARSFAARYPGKIRVLEHAGRQNCGVSASRNLGLRHAVGEFACFLDADDVFLPHKLATELKVLAAHPEAIVVCGAYEYWYSWTGAARDAGRDFAVTLGAPPERLYQPPALLLHNLRAGGRKPGTSSIMFRRANLGADLCEESFVGLGDDQVLWAKLSLLVPIFVTDECLFKYRQHPDSLCAVAMKDGEDFAAWQKFLGWLETYLRNAAITDPQLWRALRNAQKSSDYQIRFAPLKLLVRRWLPLRARYRLRNKLIELQSLRKKS